MPLLHIDISSSRLTWDPGTLTVGTPSTGIHGRGREHASAVHCLVWHVPLVALGSVWG